MTVWSQAERLDAELLDTLQADRQGRGKPLHVRTAETAAQGPLLICPYCGRRRCDEHADLPALDPFYS